MEAGSELLHDIFRRADKDDNGVLSFDEFVDMFGDTVLTNEQLKTLFEKVDTDKNGTIETSELASFFITNIGELSPFFGALDTLNAGLTPALNHIHEIQQGGNEENMAVKAFFLRQIGEHLVVVADALRASHNSLQAEEDEVAVHVTHPNVSDRAHQVMDRVEGSLRVYSERISSGVNASIASLQNELRELKQLAASQTQSSSFPFSLSIISFAALGVAIFAWKKAHH
eukprot:m.5497 g.5497  ORF g.5497 m.5497 type:complete len:228 (-) comp2415_c0_seq1:208-891(-)